MTEHERLTLDEIYYSIQHDLIGFYGLFNIVPPRPTIEELCEKHTKACFHNYQLILTSSKQSNSSSARSLSATKREIVYIAHSRDEFQKVNTAMGLFDFPGIAFHSFEILQHIFPFAQFKWKQTKSIKLFEILSLEFYTEWFDPMLLLNMLPTRRNFINEILTDLDANG